MITLIHRLPPEILSHIFVVLVRASRYAASIGDRSYDEIDYPVRLSSICVHWRQVAISTPALWSFLDICRSKYSLEYIEYLNVCCQRSGNASLSLRLGKYDKRYDQDAGDEQLVPLLNSCATRLESFATAYYSPGVAKQLLSPLVVRGVATRVRKLALHAHWEDDVILADHSLPQRVLDELLEPLHSLCLAGVAFDWDTIRCRNLVELQLSSIDILASPSPSQLTYFLNANPTIRKLKISALGVSTYQTTLPPIKLPELQNLELEMYPEFTQGFLALLTPGTRDITLRVYSYVPESDRPQFTNTLRHFFQRSRIVTLRIPTNNFVPFSGVADCLPHLETLGVDAPRSGYDLSEIDTQTNLLPKLHTVELVQCTTRDMESGLGTVLSLPSVQHILFPDFHSVDDAGSSTSMDIDQFNALPMTVTFIEDV
ncbi:hypothetical protein BDV93DRAFT_604690 [Ceratobasidium sp. AG-I]|nr:hypothetical protein BDV93DRAFT_604690 [Ceratobasidium sp. AG-I]